MSGSIAYIKADRLIGVPFQSRYIRFYLLDNKSIVFKLYIGPFYTISSCGLLYLSHRKMIVTNTLNVILKYSQNMNSLLSSRNLSFSLTYLTFLVYQEILELLAKAIKL